MAVEIAEAIGAEVAAIVKPLERRLAVLEAAILQRGLASLAGDTDALRGMRGQVEAILSRPRSVFDDAA
jgi:hypothetical protein